MALFFRKIRIRSSLQPDACHRILIKRTKKSAKYVLSETTNSLMYKNYFIATLSWWDWYNSYSEPKLIGKIASSGSGTVISGYYIPGFGALLVPILIPPALCFFAIWLSGLWIEPLAPNVDATRYYSVLALLSVVLTSIALGIIWLCSHDRWEGDELLNKLLRVLQGELIGREQ